MPYSHFHNGSFHTHHQRPRTATFTTGHFILIIKDLEAVAITQQSTTANGLGVLPSSYYF